MFGISGSEWILVALVVLVLFGGKRLPELARGLGKSVSEFKKGVREIENGVQNAAQEQSVPQPPVAVVSAAPQPARFDPYTGKPLASEPAKSE